MKIGELAAESGLSASKIRFYESVGLLRKVERQRNGYREYPPEALLVLEIIASATRAGFTLEEVRHCLPDDLKRWDEQKLTGSLRKKIASIEAMEVKLAETKASLQRVIRNIETKPSDMSCLDNAKRSLSIVKTTRGVKP